jgi:transposase
MQTREPVLTARQVTGVLRILVDRRRSPGEEQTRMISQMHWLLLDPCPAGSGQPGGIPGRGFNG